LARVTAAFQTRIFNEFKAASVAIKEAGMLTLVQAPLSLSAVTLVLEGVEAGQLEAADQYVALALHSRIGLRMRDEDMESPGLHDQLDPSELTTTQSGGCVVDHQHDVFKRLKTFFAGSKQKAPYWWLAWQSDVDAAKKHRADAIALFSPPELAAPKASTPAPPPALGGQPDFESGDHVWTQLRGSKRITGVVIDVGAHHCNIRCDPDQGSHSNTKKKTEKKKLNKVTTVGPAPAAEESVTESDVTMPAAAADGGPAAAAGGGPAAAAEEPAPAPAAERPAPAAMDEEAAHEAATAAKWGDASDVFVGFAD